MQTVATRSLAILILVCFAVTMAMAQSSSGSISGTLTDPNGAVIPGAKIQALHVETGVVSNTTSTQAGIYVFPSLPVGPYTITVEQPGFKKLVRSNIDVRLGSRLTVDLRLEVGDIQQSVEVKAEAPLLEMTTSERGANMAPTFMNKLPIFTGGIRNAGNFVTYMPGVNAGGGLGEVSIGGSGGRAKEITIDGGSLVSPESGGMAMNNVGFEAFSEFKLVTASYTAELGRFGGGVEMYNTKSGGNDIHGAAFYSIRRDIFNSAGWTSNAVLNKTPGSRAKDRFNEGGGSVGGPVYIPKVYDGRNKTFFFATWSKDLRPVTYSFVNASLPTLLQKQGNFSDLTQTIYDPATTTTVNGVISRTPFAGNIVPKARWSKVSSNFLSQLPDPTGPGISNNYTHTNWQKYNNVIWTLKFDHSFNPNNRVAFYMSHFDSTEQNIQTLPGVLGTGIDNIQRPQQYRWSHDWVIKPTLLLHSMFSYSSTRQLWETPMQAGAGSKAGLPLSGDSDVTPTITFGGLQSYTGWGPTQTKVNHGGQWNFTYQVGQGLSWMRGKHEIKIGWDARRLQTNNNDLANTNGTYAFSSNQTANPATATPTGGNAFASYLLGAVGGANQLALPVTMVNNRYGYHAGYFQDNWRVTDRLTLNLGFRYEVPLPWHENSGNFSTLDPTMPNAKAGGLPGALIFAGYGAGRQNKKYLTPMDWSNIGPRLGFAYRISNKTTFRGGWGIYYQALGNGGCGCTTGFNYTYSIPGGQPTDAVLQWDGGFQFGAGYVPPPVIDPTYANKTSATYMSDTFGQAPRVYTWSATLQHELKGWLLEAGYVGNRSHKLNSTVSMNQLPTRYLALGPLLNKNINDPAVAALGYKEPYAGFATQWGTAATLGQALKPFPQYTSVSSINAGVGRSWNDSLQTKVERRFGSLTFMGHYTFAKSLGRMHYRQIFGQTGYAQDSYNIPDAKSYLPFDQTHVAVFMANYDLPFGKGKRFLGSSGRLIDTLIGGWSVSGIEKYVTGNLLQLGSTTNNTNIGTQIQKANLTGKTIRTGVNRGDLDPNNP
ncbi:MAG TPA: TonB-dependent receptor, partial [Bryobacteraceae bacterium]|nr:TonB-dependent receptor [Bryobacteraceae bacterium]